MRTNRLIAIAGLALFGLSSQASASTFTFSFTNGANGGGIVTGTIVLNAADTAAVSLTVDSNTAGFGVGQYVGNPGENTFTVVAGQITAITAFSYFGNMNSSPDVTCCSLGFEVDSHGFAAGLANSPGGPSEETTDLTFTPVATPLPAALPLFATGLGGLGLLGWRRKRKAQAVA